MIRGGRFTAAREPVRRGVVLERADGPFRVVSWIDAVGHAQGGNRHCERRRDRSNVRLKATEHQDTTAVSTAHGHHSRPLTKLR
jgi:hypothetical protein